LEFYPDRYYIGTMDPDEVFTISFSVASQPGRNLRGGPVNISFTAQYKNGEEWHLSEPFITTYEPAQTQQQNSSLLPAGAVLIILLACGSWVYRRRRRERRAVPR